MAGAAQVFYGSGAQQWTRLGRGSVIPGYGVPGSYRPDATTTGPRAGVTLQRHDGDITTAAGQTLENLDIYGKVTVAAPNVTINNCIIRGSATASTNEACIMATSSSCTNLVVQDCRIVAQTPSIWVNGIMGHDFTLQRCDISGVVDAVNVYNSGIVATGVTSYNLNVKILANWLHDLSYYTPDPNHNDNQTHNDLIQIQGGNGLLAVGNNLSSYYSTTVGSRPLPRAQALSVVLFNVNVGTTGGHTITDNWCDGGMIPFNCGGAPNVNLGTIVRNQFDGNSGSTGTPPHTITLASTQTCVTGDGTTDQNTFYKAGTWGAAGTPVLVRHNG